MDASIASRGWLSILLQRKKLSAILDKSMATLEEAGRDSASVDGPNVKTAQVDHPVNAKLAAVLASMRAALFDSFARVTLAMMAEPRYRSQSLADLQHLVFEPLVRDRIAIAYAGNSEGAKGTDMVGFAIWASVSDDVDTKIREQIAAGNFPLRLLADDWASGEISWLIDIVAPDRKAATAVFASLGQVVKSRPLKVHPGVARLVDMDALEKRGLVHSHDEAKTGS